MTTLVTTRVYVLNGELVHTSTPQTRDERGELNLLSHLIGETIKRESGTEAFDVSVANDTISVVPVPGVVDFESLDKTVEDAIRFHRIGGSKLDGANPSLGGAVKAIRDGSIRLEGSKEAAIYYVGFVVVLKLLEGACYAEGNTKYRLSRFTRATTKSIKLMKLLMSGRMGM